MYAGLEYSKGDLVTLMDADLQDPPSLLEEMYILVIMRHISKLLTCIHIT